MLQISGENVNSQQENEKLIERSLLDHLFVQRMIAIAFATQAVIIVVTGNIDILSGRPKLDVIQLMIAQGVELILKAYNAEKRIGKKIDRTTNKPGE